MIWFPYFGNLKSPNKSPVIGCSYLALCWDAWALKGEHSSARASTIRIGFGMGDTVDDEILQYPMIRNRPEFP